MLDATDDTPIVDAMCSTVAARQRRLNPPLIRNLQLRNYFLIKASPDAEALNNNVTGAGILIEYRP
jgi:hypothetical protein